MFMYKLRANPHRSVRPAQCLNDYNDFELIITPIKNMRWKFHAIPRHKSTAGWSKSTPNSTIIPCHFSRFYLFSMLEDDMDFTFDTSSSHGISMGFAKKMMGFPVRIWSHFQNKPNYHGKDMRKYKVSHFLQGMYVI